MGLVIWVLLWLPAASSRLARAVRTAYFASERSRSETAPCSCRRITFSSSASARSSSASARLKAAERLTLRITASTWPRRTWSPSSARICTTCPAASGTRLASASLSTVPVETRKSDTVPWLTWETSTRVRGSGRNLSSSSPSSLLDSSPSPSTWTLQAGAERAIRAQAASSAPLCSRSVSIGFPGVASGGQATRAGFQYFDQAVHGVRSCHAKCVHLFPGGGLDTVTPPGRDRRFAKVQSSRTGG
jgi:hypothetical protein